MDATARLYNCIRDDPEVVKRIDETEFVDTPLHIAVAGGHTEFAMAIVYLQPSFPRKLNKYIFSPMHLALENGHEDTMLNLMAVDDDLVRVKGREGYTLLHHVAREGNLDLLAQFLVNCPNAIAFSPSSTGHATLQTLFFTI